MRMVHIRNISHILKYGIVHRESEFADPGYISIGDNSMIESRNRYKIQGTDHCLGDYIPFYFGPRTPMLYAIQCGNKNVIRRKPDEIVYCVILIQEIIKAGIKGYFTDGHARDAMTSFYSNDMLSHLNEFVRYEDVYAKDWGLRYDNTGESKRRKSAELLLEDNISPDLIRWFVVYNESAKADLLKCGVVSDKVIIKSDFYFP